MTHLHLIVDNPDPRPRLHECAAEQLQTVDSEEGEAVMWARMWAVYFAGMASMLVLLFIGLAVVETFK